MAFSILCVQAYENNGATRHHLWCGEDNNDVSKSHNKHMG